MKIALIILSLIVFGLVEWSVLTKVNCGRWWPPTCIDSKHGHYYYYEPDGEPPR